MTKPVTGSRERPAVAAERPGAVALLAGGARGAPETSREEATSAPARASPSRRAETQKTFWRAPSSNEMRTSTFETPPGSSAAARSRSRASSSTPEREELPEGLAGPRGVGRPLPRGPRRSPRGDARRRRRRRAGRGTASKTDAARESRAPPVFWRATVASPGAPATLLHRGRRRVPSPPLGEGEERPARQPVDLPLLHRRRRRASRRSRSRGRSTSGRSTRAGRSPARRRATASAGEEPPSEAAARAARGRRRGPRGRSPASSGRSSSCGRRGRSRPARRRRRRSGPRRRDAGPKRCAASAASSAKHSSERRSYSARARMRRDDDGDVFARGGSERDRGTAGHERGIIARRARICRRPVVPAGRTDIMRVAPRREPRTATRWPVPTTPPRAAHASPPTSAS